MSLKPSDRRQGPRSPSSGTVEILFDDPMPVAVEAELEETSERGFRISHDSERVFPGLEVDLKRDGTVQRARVIWTHVLKGRRVCGCLLL